MNTEVEIFGAKAAIEIKFDGDITLLADKLSKELMLTNLDVEVDEYPPHQLIASAEVLGWIIWLNPKNAGETHTYVLEMETEHALDESIRNRMHDLSPWFARYVSMACDLETSVLGTQIAFKCGKFV